MGPGAVVADRFVVRALAAAGGMGTIYRADDRLEGREVALKLIDPREEIETERFVEEARVLAGFAHPSVVRYVAHGVTESRQAWLAMEWLEGEDLARVLGHRALDVEGSLELARRVAEGLAAVHARGIVHRDIKPSNVFLVGGDPRAAKLLDFGVARKQTRTRVLTRTGAIMGTVGYMAPEQATGDRTVDARVDVFALGCVLFECLTGRPAFVGNHLVTVLAKVLCEDAPRVRDLRPELPSSLDEVLARMLAKDRDGRFADGAEVKRALDALGHVSGEAPHGGARRGPLLTAGEQRILSVILVEGTLRREVEESVARSLESGAASTLRTPPSSFDPLRTVAETYGGVVHPLASGALLVTMHGAGSADDLAARAASCAIAAQEADDQARIAIATGRAETMGLSPSGPVIDRAGSVLRGAKEPGIHLDEVTASLLETRFEIADPPKAGRVSSIVAHRLLRRRATLAGARTLLGRIMPCVGRDKELALLDGTLRECIDEPIARAVRVVGEAGTGKSRLAQEFVSRARATFDLEVLLARADTVGGAGALSLVRQLVRHGAGLREVDGAHASDAFLKLRASCGDGADSTRIAEVLADVLGFPVAEPSSPVVRAARAEPRLMREWIQRSFEDWLEARVRERPVVIVLEDVHWGDAPSLKYLSDAMRRLADQPLLVMALGRPEMGDLFAGDAGAFSSSVIDVHLGGLTRKAAERLVRAALGDADASLVAKLVERADGNAFYLEELIRHVAAGDATDFPESLLAMVQARLSGLDQEARRVLRAASVFGGVAWEGGISALLGGARNEDVGRWLDGLVAEEILVARRGSKFRRAAEGGSLESEREVGFRHALLREAIYATLTDADRALGHALAAEWLEGAGERNALVIAEHWEHAGETARALPWLAQAARTALDANEIDAAVALAERGLTEATTVTVHDVAAARETEGVLRRVLTHACGWRSAFRPALEHARIAMQLASPGSPEWFESVAAVVFAGVNLGDPTSLVDVVPLLSSRDLDPAPTGPYGFATMLLVVGLSIVGQRALAETFLARLDRAEAREPGDAAFVGWSRIGRSHFEVQEREALGAGLTHAIEAEAAFAPLGDPVGRAMARYFASFARFECGDYDGAREGYAQCEREAQATGAEFTRLWSRYWLARIAAETSRLDEAIVILDSIGGEHDLQLTDNARVLRAQVLLDQGRVEEAEATARGAIDSMLTTAKATAHAVLARAALVRDDAERALGFADAGLAGCAEVAAHPIDRMCLRAVRIEALQRRGDVAVAKGALDEARERVERIEGELPSEMRPRFRAIRPVSRVLQLKI